MMDALEHGYVIPFEKFPTEYEEPNNKSALREPDFVCQAIMDLKKTGVVEFVSEKPHCVSPLSVSFKTGRDGSIKQRLCLDGSRCINDCIKKQKVTLSHLQRALDLSNRVRFKGGVPPCYDSPVSSYISRRSLYEARRRKSVFCFPFSPVRTLVCRAMHYQDP